MRLGLGSKTRVTQKFDRKAISLLPIFFVFVPSRNPVMTSLSLPGQGCASLDLDGEVVGLTESGQSVATEARRIGWERHTGTLRLPTRDLEPEEHTSTRQRR